MNMNNIELNMMQTQKNTCKGKMTEVAIIIAS